VSVTVSSFSSTINSALGEKLPLYWWLVFNIIVILLLLIDLLFWHRKSSEIPFRKALNMSAFWILLSLLFNLFICFTLGFEKGVTFFTGYLIEKSLSVDNLFVFLLVFTQFQVPTKDQHHVLFLGIIGALIMRAIFIFSGIALLHRFEWLIYVLGLFLVVSGGKLLFEKVKPLYKQNDEEEEKPFLVKFFSNLDKSLNDGGAATFFRKDGNKWRFGKLFYVLIIVEFTDLVFALDSIPAILAITRDPFIVYSSNVCAILGLRALYFALAGLRDLFGYLDHALSFILLFVGLKMLLREAIKFPDWFTLGVVATILLWAIFYSMHKAKNSEQT
jgi:tellurite resistance protein TerC